MYGDEAFCGYRARVFGSIFQTSPWLSGMLSPGALLGKWSLVVARGGDSDACLKHAIWDTCGSGDRLRLDARHFWW